jgi:hypothetical protein
MLLRTWVESPQLGRAEGEESELGPRAALDERQSFSDRF